MDRTTRQPFFSIVIPTFNRCELLTLSIQSVLWQTFHDFELVVSDNFSNDRTSEAVKGFGDSRIRYVRTERHLMVPESFEFARLQARGRYILMLGDDDALSAPALECFAKAATEFEADLLFCSPSHYWEAVSGPPWAQAGSLEVRPFSGMVLKVDPLEEFVRPLFKLKLKYEIHPSFYVFARALADRIAERTGRFFHPPITECAALLLAALHVESILYLDLPLSVVGHTSRSYGTNLDIRNFRHTDPKSYEVMLTDVRRDLRLVPVKLKEWLYWNYVAESLLRVKELLPEALQDFQFDEVAYFRALLTELQRKRALGFDVEEGLAELIGHLNSRPEIRDACLPPKASIATITKRIRRLIGDLNARNVRDWIKARKEGRLTGINSASETGPEWREEAYFGDFHKELREKRDLGLDPVIVPLSGLRQFHNILECAKYLEVYIQHSPVLSHSHG